MPDGAVRATDLHDYPPLRLSSTDIVQRKCTIGSYTCKYGRLGQVEAHGGDGLSGGGEGEVRYRSTPAVGLAEARLTVEYAYFVSSHTCTMVDAVANNGSERW